MERRWEKYARIHTIKTLKIQQQPQQQTTCWVGMHWKMSKIGKKWSIKNHSITLNSESFGKYNNIVIKFKEQDDGKKMKCVQIENGKGQTENERQACSNIL